VDDIAVLEDLNSRFIEAFRRGSWELLEPVLSPSFAYLDGVTGEIWPHERYVEESAGPPGSVAHHRSGGRTRGRRRSGRLGANLETAR
jgi:hypothetical protein